MVNNVNASLSLSYHVSPEWQVLNAASNGNSVLLLMVKFLNFKYFVNIPK